MNIIVTSVIAFAATNIDDVFILMLFFGDKRFRASDIYLGHYVGIGLLVLISIIGSVIGNFIDSKYIGLLGLFPIYLGIRHFIQLIKKGNETETLDSMAEAGLLTVATTTFANGGDNIGTYIPLFAVQTTGEKMIMVFIFLVMILIWVTAANYLTKHPILARVISAYGHRITPIVLVLLGLFIIYENETLGLFK